jgi:hypothetical protein
MPSHIRGALAEKKSRAAGRAHHRAGMTHGIAVHQDHRHRGVSSPVERLREALVRPEVCAERSAQVIVEPDRRILRPR